MNAEIRELAFNLAPVSELRKAALNSGMQPLVQDGRRKVLGGVTTADEIASIAQVDLDNESSMVGAVGGTMTGADATKK